MPYLFFNYPIVLPGHIVPIVMCVKLEWLKNLHSFFFSIIKYCITWVFCVFAFCDLFLSNYGLCSRLMSGGVPNCIKQILLAHSYMSLGLSTDWFWADWISSQTDMLVAEYCRIFHLHPLSKVRLGWFSCELGRSGGEGLLADRVEKGYWMDRTQTESAKTRILRFASICNIHWVSWIGHVLFTNPCGLVNLGGSVDLLMDTPTSLTFKLSFFHSVQYLSSKSLEKLLKILSQYEKDC